MIKYIIHYNYLIDIYPWRSFIISIGVVSFAVGAFFLNLFILSTLLYLIFTFMIIIRTINDSHKVPESIIGKWFIKRNNMFFMFKRNKDYIYDDFIIYIFNINENPILKQLKLRQQTYEMYYDSEYGINLTYSRLANKKEIEKYSLRTLEAKILLLRDNERIKYH